MGETEDETAGGRLRTLFGAGAVGNLADGRLLERFAARDGEAAELAFAVLVERHGPMVLSVCRSVLRDPHQADDAFQASFLVLARRAPSLRVNGSLGPWLHQVAYRVSLAARAAAARRQKHERRAGELAAWTVREDGAGDLAEVLHEEVNRLPRNCQEAVVLCYFEGLSPSQASRRLGCPLGTVQSRLARGRERLRSRLARRGVAPAMGLVEAGLVANANAAGPPASLVAEAVRAAAQSGLGTGAVASMARGVMRSMILTKLRMTLGVIAALAAVIAGARPWLRGAPAPLPPPDLPRIRHELGATEIAEAPRPRPAAEAVPPWRGLAWAEVAPDEMQGILQRLAEQSRGNYEKIRTWKGSYAVVVRKYLDENFVSQLPPAARGGKHRGPLIQEFDRTLAFAFDPAADSLYRDLETSRMRFLVPGTHDEVTIPNVGARDHRSILTPTTYLDFDPKERATSSFLPDHPDAQNKRMAKRFPEREARMREGGEPDPRDFFKTDPGNTIWSEPELYAQALKGLQGAESLKTVAERLRLLRAAGPGGTWYCGSMSFGNPGEASLTATTVWSPQAGYNPVSHVRTSGKEDGTPESKIEWGWKRIGDVYVPESMNATSYRPDGVLSRGLEARLKDCAVNRPLDPHQFDERGLGLEDGDLILDHNERVAYIMKGGKPVRLAAFGERSILKSSPEPAPPRPSLPAAKATEHAATGRIYTTASLGTNGEGMPVPSVVAVDPNTAEVTKVFDAFSNGVRVSPDGKNVAYTAIDRSVEAFPERHHQYVWIRSTAGGEPRKVLPLNADGGGATPVWSPDGRQLLVSVGVQDEKLHRWVFESVRVNADGTDRQVLKIPPDDMVLDWSADGKTLLTASSRGAKVGWQLYLIWLDGLNMARLTDGGNPFDARFSPDGRRIVYTDGPTADRRGIWIIDVAGDGRGPRRLLETGTQSASACWSPDGHQLVVAIDGEKPEDHGRLDILELDGAHRTLLTFPGQRAAAGPDWR
ncbi:ECF RNA polymerase sigma factor SigW [Aquisphaera giovannonii]|uniref:ECF RNA polymerase sigma factor SigW n=1 Tax=Aquisphaera giovannonii TaxID=406548 RepID=A0A5B9WCU6_9BACT|nr:sigma-70 family RNA polymerase sigma factor [Aquisphaera giovannonii]QEH37761.1 ECF RNA polymerase sigma factor SigW [Aquisphaera giovannonii]